MNDVLIRLENITKSYGAGMEPAVNNLDLEVQRGEVLVLVGPSGCGKSTTLRLINRLIEPTSGRIVIDGEDVTDVNQDHC
jgi:osmoprotectant transport system ATP-binding protein